MIRSVIGVFVVLAISALAVRCGTSRTTGDVSRDLAETVAPTDQSEIDWKISEVDDRQAGPDLDLLRPDGEVRDQVSLDSDHLGLFDVEQIDASPADSHPDHFADVPNQDVADVDADVPPVGCMSDEDCSGFGAALGPCLEPFCDPEEKTCSSRPAPGQPSCDDDNPCTVEDRCSVGICIGTLKVCPDDGNVCTTAQCDPATGNCQSMPSAGPCDDHFACTSDDHCVEGACTGTPDNSACDDGQECTQNVCEPALGCQYPPVSDGTECGQRTCQGLQWWMQTCQAGTCSGSTLAEDCDLVEAPECRSKACSPEFGCRAPNLPDNTECGERYCVSLGWTYERYKEVCQNGECIGSWFIETCDDGELCTEDTCDGQLGCGHETLPDGDFCGYQYCEGIESWHQICQAGTCTGSEFLEYCGDEEECTFDECVPYLGCAHGNEPESKECGQRYCDENIDWYSLYCIAGECTGKWFIDGCNDWNACKADFCDPNVGCSHIEICCGSGTDDDEDGLMDCADPDCVGHCCDSTHSCDAQGGCTGPKVGTEDTPELCENFLDDDCDNLADCDDSDCAWVQYCGGPGQK